MARRTKEEALATRERLIDTAEDLFFRNGVSHTPLNEIALAAGVTRGAIYWHFKDKAALFNAMMERVCLPLEERLEPAPLESGSDPLLRLRSGIMAALRNLVADDRTRRVYEIATHKVEYVGELESLRAKHIEVRTTYLLEIEASLRLAVKHSDLRLRISVPAAARGLHALVNGLIQDWMLAPDEFDLVRIGRDVVGAYLAGLAEPSGADIQPTA
ncbi:TetR family transcriptional regulator BpeR [soil metagenome]